MAILYVAVIKYIVYELSSFSINIASILQCSFSADFINKTIIASVHKTCKGLLVCGEINRYRK